MSLNEQDALHNLSDAQRHYDEDMQSLLELVYPNGPVKERNIRLASVIVRRWLCDNELRRLTDHIAEPITFPVLDDEHLLENAIADPNVDYYLSAGLRFGGGPVFALYHSSADAVPFWYQHHQKPSYKLVKLSQAMKRPILYFDGDTFNLSQVLRFACNKLGGAHFDTKRKNLEQKLDDAAQYLTFGPREETLSDRRIGDIHLPVEEDGSEVLSGISVTVIVAATMLVNIHIDGNPILHEE